MYRVCRQRLDVDSIPYYRSYIWRDKRQFVRQLRFYDKYDTRFLATRSTDFHDGLGENDYFIF